MPANIAAEGSAHGGQLMGARLGAAAAAGLAQQQQQGLMAPPQCAVLDAVFVETGFLPAAEVAEAQAALLQQLNAAVRAKQLEGFAVVEFKSGAEREAGLRNLYYHVLLRKAVAAA